MCNVTEAAPKAWRNRLIEHFAERGEEFAREGRLVRRPERMLYSPLYPDISSVT
ncbi:MAG: hypothetical protein ACYTE5_01345 [Planctomycetota bacterium]